MIFKHILFGGFLFATAYATATPDVATLEVMPNFDQGLTRKDFRVIYPGFQEAGPDVTIKIYKDSVPESAFYTFKVPEGDVTKQKAYFFGLDDATSGNYSVQVCKGVSCSGKTSSLSEIPNKKGQVKCKKGLIGKSGEWTADETAEVVLDITQPGAWLDSNQIDTLENAMKGKSNSHYTEWRKNGVQNNPGYDNKVLYIGVNYDIVKYKPMFMTKEVATEAGQTSEDNLYVDEFCERKYLLSFHVHLLDKNSKEVKYRFKRTLHMSEKGKKYFIIDNEEGLNRQVHVEMAFPNTEIATGTYRVWVSLCTTEKDAIDSTMCSDPVVERELKVSK